MSWFVSRFVVHIQLFGQEQRIVYTALFLLCFLESFKIFFLQFDEFPVGKPAGVPFFS